MTAEWHKVWRVDEPEANYVDVLARTPRQAAEGWCEYEGRERGELPNPVVVCVRSPAPDQGACDVAAGPLTTWSVRHRTVVYHEAVVFAESSGGATEAPPPDPFE